MRIGNAFPSDYLKASDLDGRQIKVTMSHVEMRDIGGDHKPILFFQGKDKGMVLNKTNSNNISVMYGDETEDWKGKEIVLFEAQVDFQGKTVAAIRVRQPRAQDRPQLVASAAATPDDHRAPPVGRAQLDDDIPF